MGMQHYISDKENSIIAQIKNELLSDPTIPLLGIYCKDMKAVTQRDR